MKKQENRLVYLDVLRVIATLFVIGVHTVSLGASLVPERSVQWYGFEICNYLFVCCNLLFIMISGALLIPVKGERAWQFYRKRFLKVLVPMVIYYILYVCAKEGIEWIFPDHWWILFKRMLLGAPEEAPHFWLIYVILGLYVLTPFLRFLMQHIPDAVLNGVVIVILVCNTLYIGFDIFYGNPVVKGIVESFAGVFLLGYFLTKEHTFTAKMVVYVAGILSVAASVWLIFSGMDFSRYIFNNAPLMIFYSMAVFLLVKELFWKKQTEPVWVRKISRQSFGMLLIHWGVLHYVVKQMLHVNVLAGYGIVGSIGMILLTTVLSYIGSSVVDWILISPLLKLLGRF